MKCPLESSDPMLLEEGPSCPDTIPSHALAKDGALNVWSLEAGVLPASVNIAHFRGRSGVAEYHLMICPTESDSFDAQLEWVFRAYQRALDSIGVDAQSAVLRRFFCSDVPNQASALEAHPFSNPRTPDEPCAVSWVGQTPLAPARVALWAYHVCDPHSKLDKVQEGTTLTLQRGPLAHHWATGLTHTAMDSAYDQTRGVLEEYDVFLQAQGMSLADSAVRTWFFVQNIDANYHGLVDARREFFAERGLTPATHFIASTGVEGGPANLAAKVALDAYAIAGLRREQIAYLAAPDHLCPTHVYGVTFERGTAVAYRDRTHIYLSGTASIGPEGTILYPGDLARQLDRTLENMQALLRHGGAGLEDLCAVIAYVRDSNDQVPAAQQLRKCLGEVPIQVVTAPVCRPGWLVELEAIAIRPASNPTLPKF